MVGQSGTAIPTPLLVTNPPRPISKNVQKAAKIAKKCRGLLELCWVKRKAKKQTAAVLGRSDSLI